MASMFATRLLLIVSLLFGPFLVNAQTGYLPPIRPLPTAKKVTSTIRPLPTPKKIASAPSATNMDQQDIQDAQELVKKSVLFSPNKKYKAAVSIKGGLLAGGTDSILISDANGKNIKTFGKKYLSNGYYKLIRWNTKNNRIYFSHEPEGVGNVSNYGGYASLSYVDLQKHIVVDVVPYKYFAKDFVTDISSDDTYVAFVTDSTILHIKNMKTSHEIHLGVQGTPYNTGVGNAHFSPDGHLVAYNIGPIVMNGDSSILVASTINGKPRTLKKIKEGQDTLNVNGWQSNSAILVDDLDTNTSYTLSLNGTMKKK